MAVRDASLADRHTYRTVKLTVPVTPLRWAVTVTVPGRKPVAVPRLPAALLTSATVGSLDSQVT